MNSAPYAVTSAVLLDGLAQLVADHGFENFVRSRLLEPDNHHFPDRWEPTLDGVQRLASRLVRYAGNDELEVCVRPERGAVLPVWFAEIRDGVCAFGVDRQRLSDAGEIVGCVCREVATAFRHWTGVTRMNGTQEEVLTDLTTIYLGFGVLTTNAAYRFRQEGSLFGDTVFTKRSISRVGVLPAATLAYALAADVVARGLDASAASRIGRLLEANQEESFTAAYESLALDVAGLRSRLGLPPVEEWPEARALRRVRFPRRLPTNVQRVPTRGVSANGNSTPNVFRVRERAALRWGASGSIPGFLGALGAHWIGVDPIVMLLIGGLGGAVIGVARADGNVTDVCSDQDCRSPLPVDVSHCPSCGGRIRGVIRDARERLAAEEALTEERARTPYRG